MVRNWVNVEGKTNGINSIRVKSGVVCTRIKSISLGFPGVGLYSGTNSRIGFCLVPCRNHTCLLQSSRLTPTNANGAWVSLHQGWYLFPATPQQSVIYTHFAQLLDDKLVQVVLHFHLHIHLQATLYNTSCSAPHPARAQTLLKEVVGRTLHLLPCRDCRPQHITGGTRPARLSTPHSFP